MTTLAAALVAAQKEMPAVTDNARANYGTYVTLDHLIAKTRKVLNDHGLAIVQFPTITDLGAPALRTILIHGESGEKLSADAPLFLNGKQDMQALGGAITYARRYGWGAALGISTDSDDDGQAISAPIVAKPASASTNGGEFKFPSGKHKDKTLTEVPGDYLDWYIANGPREDVKLAINMHREFAGAAAPTDEDIPF